MSPGERFLDWLKRLQGQKAWTAAPAAFRRSLAFPPGAYPRAMPYVEPFLAKGDWRQEEREAHYLVAALYAAGWVARQGGVAVNKVVVAAVDIEPGKTLIIRFVSVSTPHADGTRTVFFELNGQPREITVVDQSVEATGESRVKADPAISGQVGATMPGMVVNVAVKVGDRIKKGQKLLALEAMKMETMINAELDGKIRDVLVQPGTRVETGDLLVVIEPE